MLRPKTSQLAPVRNMYMCCFQVEKEMADVVGQAEEKERRLNKSRKKLERKLVGGLPCSFWRHPSCISAFLPPHPHDYLSPIGC